MRLESNQRFLNKRINKEFEFVFKNLSFESRTKAGLFFVCGIDFVMEWLMRDLRYTSSRDQIEKQLNEIRKEIDSFKVFLEHSIKQEKRGGIYERKNITSTTTDNP